MEARDRACALRPVKDSPLPGHKAHGWIVFLLGKATYAKRALYRLVGSGHLFLLSRRQQAHRVFKRHGPQEQLLSGSSHFELLIHVAQSLISQDSLSPAKGEILLFLSVLALPERTA
ncbi:hypothetical protein NDU88_004876 [Pleurodeles waltl]|uniref:Uncharacterized protein n=1 Tax=Pleurodeles waltl TaxID=8319 RepID=A0AAV7PHZ6_PLEWA|nr:hypothetical protein NDU88_004876 [Pleurodeles waltl]